MDLKDFQKQVFEYIEYLQFDLKEEEAVESLCPGAVEKAYKLCESYLENNFKDKYNRYIFSSMAERMSLFHSIFFF